MTAKLPRRDRRGIVVCCGAISLENVVRVPALPARGDAVSAVGAYYRLGRGALAVGAALSAWGLDVAVAGNAVGEDLYAELLFEELAPHPRLDRRWIVPQANVQTPFTRTFLTADGRQYSVRYWFGQAQPVGPSRAGATRAALVTIDASDCGEHVKLARRARVAGIPVVVAGATRPDHPLVALSDVLIVQAARLRAKYPDTDPREPAHALQAAGARVVVVSEVEEPVWILASGGTRIEIPACGPAAVDGIGAEDLFRAAFIYGWWQGRDLSACGRLGGSAMALWAATPAALQDFPSMAEIEELCRRSTAVEPAQTGQRSETGADCPICREQTSRFLLERHVHLDTAVIKRLRAAYPSWRREEGVCPRCVRPFTGGPADSSGRVAEAGHPVYGMPEPGVLPVALRARADLRYAGRGTVICFLDSGFYPHPDLTRPRNRILACVDASREGVIETADFSIPQATSWHGLMSSAVAAGEGSFSGGKYRGLATEAGLVLVKVSDPRGRVTEAGILRGMTWVLRNHERYGIRIVNLSVGGDRPRRPSRSALDRAVDDAVRRGIAVIAAAGNSGTAELCPPASARYAVTVGGLDDRNTLDRSEHRLYDSNWSVATDGGSKPEVIAPSAWVAAPVLPGTIASEQNPILDALWRSEDEAFRLLLQRTWPTLGLNPALLAAPVAAQREAVRRKMVENKVLSRHYQYVDGTSFAAPIVSSVVAQMLEAYPDLTPERIKRLLTGTAERLANEPRERQGYGVVVAGRAVAAALRARHGQAGNEPFSPYEAGGRIHFVYHDPAAQSVKVIGDFNDWRPAALPMVEDRPGVWRASLARPTPGEYQYKFLVNGNRWSDDPENSLKEPDGYGGLNSVLLVPRPG